MTFANRFPRAGVLAAFCALLVGLTLAPSSARPARQCRDQYGDII